MPLGARAGRARRRYRVLRRLSTVRGEEAVYLVVWPPGVWHLAGTLHSSLRDAAETRLFPDPHPQQLTPRPGPFRGSAASQVEGGVARWNPRRSNSVPPYSHTGFALSLAMQDAAERVDG